MSTLLTVLSVVALLVALASLFAPQMTLAWRAPARRTRVQAVVLYLLLAMVLGLAARFSAGQEEKELAAQSENTAAQLNATAPDAPAFNATIVPAPLPEDDAGKTAPANATGQNPDQTQTQEKEQSFMDTAQEHITRAANATREFGGSVAEGAREIGGELVEGAGEAGQQLLDSAKEVKDELLNKN